MLGQVGGMAPFLLPEDSRNTIFLCQKLSNFVRSKYCVSLSHGVPTFFMPVGSNGYSPGAT